MHESLGKKYRVLTEDKDRIHKLETKLNVAKKIIQKLLEEEKENMYWECNGSDKSSYFKVKKEAEEFLKKE